eukprot:TRINITY_DN665_c1_g1_i3.p1 TRINITY_DN665_c1_g1~~TRINITY_DN665_c1_g1_i3.p1  ORF type:complete len:351 (+),score=45.08 TRINITY_DN665_c1_g1_i3:122-1174(+)
MKGLRACTMRTATTAAVLGATIMSTSVMAFVAGSWRCDSSSRPQTLVSLATSADDTFDREHERVSLDQLIKAAPSGLTGVVGPPSSGKSYLFEDFWWRQRENGPVCYIDCRGFKAELEPLAAHVATLGLPSFTIARPDVVESISESFTRTLLGFLGSFKVSVQLPGKANATSTYDAATTLKLLSEQPAASLQLQQPLDLQEVLEAYENMVAAWEQRRSLKIMAEKLQWPVLIIDEANKLGEWGPEHQKDLDGLISFFIWITKQAKRCHVIMVTSECGFEGWLKQQSGLGDIFFYDAYVVGHFAAKDAKEFLKRELKASLRVLGHTHGDVAVSELEWQQIYEVRASYYTPH